jgi:outer membrane receptor protein involved in Fe transport
VFKKLSLSLSYSTRQNIIYYETYKTIIDQLLAMASTQGYMFQANYRPTKNLTIGANAGYRFSKLDPRPSKNLYSYVTYSNLPWLNASATISATILETTYLSGSIYSIGLSRDLIPGKLYGGLDYRHVNYKFVNAEAPLVQNMAEMNMTWRIMKKLSCSLNYEGTFEKARNYDRIYVNLTQRF